MFAVSEGISALAAAFIESVKEYRRAHPLEPYLVLVPGYAWSERLKQQLAVALDADTDGLPLPGGEFLNLADAAFRAAGERRARQADLYDAARAAVLAMTGPDGLRPAIVEFAASGLITAYAAGLSPESLSGLPRQAVLGHHRLETLRKALRASSKALEQRGCSLPEQAMMHPGGFDAFQHGALFVFGFYDLNAAQEKFLKELIAAFRDAGKATAVFSPVPETGWGEFAARTIRFFSEALGEQPESLTCGENPQDAWQVYRAASVRDEAALAVSLVRDALASGDVAPRDIAVIARDIAPYTAVIRALFMESDIPFTVFGGAALLELPAGRVAAAFFEFADTLSSTVQAGDERYLPLGSFIKLIAMPACITAHSVTAFSRELVAGGIITLGDLRRILGSKPGTPGSVRKSNEVDAECLEEFSGFVELIVSAVKDWGEGHIDGMAALFEKLIVPASPGAPDVKGLLSELPKGGRDLPGLARYLLSRTKVQVTCGDGVVISDVMSVRGLMPRYMVLMGVNEAAFPRRAGGGGLFGYDLRAVLNEHLKESGVRFPLRHDVLPEERLLFALLVSSADRGAITFSGGKSGGGGVGGLSRMVREMFGESEVVDYFPGTGSEKGVPAAVRDGFSSFLSGMAAQEFTPAEGLVSPDAVPAEIRLSASLMENYLTCPYLALLRFMLDIPERFDPPYMEPLPRDVWGRAVHDVLDAIFENKKLAGLSADKAFQMAADTAASAFNKLEKKGLVRKGLIWNEKRERVAHQIAGFVKSFVERGAVAGVEGEQQFSIPLGDEEGVTLNGRVDRVDRKDDGSVTIVDYKTGRPGNTKRFAPQMAVYRKAISELLGVDAEMVAPELVYFDRPLTDDVETAAVKLPPADAVDKGLAAVVDAFRKGAFMRYPEDDNTCASCAMYQVCLVSAAPLRRRKSAAESARLVDDAREAFGA